MHAEPSLQIGPPHRLSADPEYQILASLIHLPDLSDFMGQEIDAIARRGKWGERCSTF